jgi:glycosyltransferase involved in cell wall biosynthesis
VRETILVVPCYNEAGRLRPDRFEEFLAREPHVRILAIDDGSTDRTPDLLRELEKRTQGRLRTVHLAYNQGKAEAVRQGMLAALAEGPAQVGFWDADLATPLEALSDFERVLEDHPRVLIALGSRVLLLGRTIHRSSMRHYAGRVFATAASLVLGLGVYDTQCGAKLLRAGDEAERLFRAPFLTRWIFDVELLARLIESRASGGREAAEEALYELPLRHWHDVPGSKVRARDFIRALRDLLRIHRRYHPRARLRRRDRASARGVRG